VGLIFRMYMLPYQERVVSEKNELDAKIGALHLFFDTPTFQALLAEEQQLLAKQYGCMVEYTSVLDARIKRFPK
jgi:hypothetical protein